MFIDNYYSSLFLYYEFKAKNTGAVGTFRFYRKGIPKKVVESKLKTLEENTNMSYNDEISLIKI